MPQLRDNRYYTTNALVHAWSTAVLQHQMQCRSVRSIHTRHSHLHVTDGKLNVHDVLSPVALTLHTVSVTHSICGHINTVTHIYLSYWLHIILWLHWYWLCGLLESGSGCWSRLPAAQRPRCDCRPPFAFSVLILNRAVTPNTETILNMLLITSVYGIDADSCPQLILLQLWFTALIVSGWKNTYTKTLTHTYLTHS